MAESIGVNVNERAEDEFHARTGGSTDEFHGSSNRRLVIGE
jgi:hypothetical protein